MRSAQKSADAERVFRKLIKHWGVLGRGVSQVPKRAPFSRQHAVNTSIQTLERHQVSLVAAESRSAVSISINTTTFMHNAG